MTPFPLFVLETTFWTENERQLQEEDIWCFSGVDPKFSQMEWDLMWGDGGFVTGYVHDSTSFSKTLLGAVTHFEVGSWYGGVKLTLPSE